jgi:hypothetical protein
MGWAVGTVLSVPNGDNIIFSIEREYVKGPFEDAVVGRLDVLRPHLARAAVLSSRLGFERARAVAQAFRLSACLRPSCAPEAGWPRPTPCLIN